MSEVQGQNLTASGKRAISVADVKPWPEVLHSIRFRDPLWKWVLAAFVLAVLMLIGIAMQEFLLEYLPVWIYQDVLTLYGILTALVILMIPVLMVRIFCRRKQRVLQAEDAKLMGMGDTCRITDVRKLRWKMTIPHQLRELDVVAVEGGFAGKGGVGRLILPNGAERVPQGLLRGCRRLVCVHLPAALREIPERMMEKCVRLQAVVIPVSAEKIGARAFAGCRSLRDVYITAGTKEIAEDAFEGCARVMFHVQEASAAETYAKRHGVNYTYH